MTRDQGLAWELGPKHPWHGCVIQYGENTTNVANIIHCRLIFSVVPTVDCKCVEAEFIIKLNKSRVLETVLLQFS